jgi:hypothetical protein
MPLKMKWVLLGRNTALLGSWFMVCGSIAIITSYEEARPWMIIYAWLVAFALLLFLYPLEELGQILIIVQNYWINGFGLIGLGVLPTFSITTMPGGILLIVGGVLYLVAGMNGEQGQTLEKLGEIWKKPRWWQIWETWSKD